MKSFFNLLFFFFLINIYYLVQPALAFNNDKTDEMWLSAYSLSKSTAIVAGEEHSTQVWNNPALIPNPTHLVLSHSHSSRHFPSNMADGEVDQLNLDN